MRHPRIVCLFAAAMGILEAAVVVYLRRIYYPEGFGLPLVPMEPAILHTEVVRELMTLIMLLCVAWVAAESAWARLMAFLVAFGIWDLAYYAGLKLFLGWPASLLTPDILFLIPRPWVAPVLAPVLVASAWVAAGLLLHRAPYRELRVRLTDHLGSVAAAALVLASFLLPSGTPQASRFPWLLFAAGYCLGIASLLRIVLRARGGVLEDRNA